MESEKINLFTSRPSPSLSFERLNVVRVLAGCVVFLTLMNLVALYVRIYMHHAGSEFLTFIVYFFNTEAEWNLPAFYSAGALLLSGLLLALTACCIGACGKSDKRYWIGLSVIFIYMAFDELCRFHERLNEIMPGILLSMGIVLPSWFKWMWVIPVGILVLLIGLIYLKFLGRLPRRTRILFLLSGIIYVTGAMGMEVVAMLMKRVTEHSMAVLLVSAAEECLEMTGIVLFVHAILDHLAKHYGAIQIELSPSGVVSGSSQADPRKVDVTVMVPTTVIDPH